MFFLHAERSARSVSAQICANKFANILSRDKMPSTVDSFDLKGVEWSGVQECNGGTVSFSAAPCKTFESAQASKRFTNKLLQINFVLDCPI